MLRCMTTPHLSNEGYWRFVPATWREPARPCLKELGQLTIRGSKGVEVEASYHPERSSLHLIYDDSKYASLLCNWQSRSEHVECYKTDCRFYLGTLETSLGQA